MGTMFRDYIVGRIPDDWTIDRIAELLSEEFSGTWGPENANGVSVLRSTNFQNNGYLNLDSVAVREIPENHLSNKAINIGDILLERSGGGPQQPVGRVSWCDDRVTGWTFSNFCQILRPSAGVDSKFLFYALYYLHMSSITLTYQNQTTGIRNLQYKSYLRISIPLPPLPEQRKIAEILSTVDETIEKTDAIIQETQQLKKGLMQKLFTEGIGHTRFREWGRSELKGSRIQISAIEELPESWEVRKISEIAKDKKGAVKIGPFGSQLKKEEMVNSGILVFGQENVFTRDFKVGTYFISPRKFELLKSVEIFPSDIVLTMMGTIGDCCVVPEDIDRGIMDSHLMRIQIREWVNPHFIARLIRESSTVKKQVKCLSQGAIMSGLNLSLVKDIFLPIPPIDEQNSIEEILSELDAKIETEQAFKAELEQLKKGIMQILLTGKVRVKV